VSALFERFASLSLVGKALVLGAILGVIAALLIVFAGSVAVWVVLAGVLLVVFLVMAFQAVLGAISRKKSSPFERALAGASALTPMGVTEPARRARLDDLRRVFESGVEKFRAAGKNLYALPWYLVVGEPGSGKTEAIRHCNVGFPPGLQDELQGSGGTLNMNWWFTNHAVMLDTAGRLMFEEVEPGSTSEWQEFLKLLKKYRTNCPVNGMLLVIPAESLIRDTADQIEKKASRVARQLDTVQRTLGVRFPVFVVITKADLINGFREFFDSVQDPALQHQMLGWSNPASLDEPFNPEAVEEHLKVVQRRLLRRRLGLMLDPVNTENPKARRTDQVDALYAFPEALLSISPRLKQYLSMIFVQGQWSAKPLFLRGIYFTSSMREGSALDSDLASALGIPVDQLPEGRVWERDRAFFLRDLFMNKVFRERGLVTSSASTGKLRRARAALIAGVGFVGLTLLGGLTYAGSASLKSTLARPLEFWTDVGRTFSKNAQPVDPGIGTLVASGGNAAGESDRHMLPIVSKLLPADEYYQYRGDAGEDAGDLARIPGVRDENRRRATFPMELRDAAAARIQVPLIFRPAALISGDSASNLLEKDRRDAAAALTRASITLPILDSVRTRLRTDSDEFQPDWTPAAAGAMAELIRTTRAAGASVRPESVEAMLRYALLGTRAFETEGVRDDLTAIAAAMEMGGATPDASAGLVRSRDPETLRDALRTCADAARQKGGPAADELAGACRRLEQLLGAPVGADPAGDPDALDRAKPLNAALAAFLDAHQRVFGVAAPSGPETPPPGQPATKAHAQGNQPPGATAPAAPAASVPTASATQYESAAAIAGAVAQAAAQTPAKARAALPLAALSAGGAAASVEFDARYQPEAMVDVLKPVLQRRLDLSAEALTTPAESLQQSAADEYLRQYVDYWSRRVLEDALPGTRTDWDQLHRALAGSAQVWKHHGPLGQLAERIGQAARAPLNSMGDALPVAWAVRLDQLRRAADGAKGTLGNDSFERAMGAMLSSWTGLGAEAGAARSALAQRLAAPAGVNEFFGVTTSPGADTDLAQCYWRELTLRAALSLRTSARGDQPPAAADARALADVIGVLRSPLDVGPASPSMLSPSIAGPALAAFAALDSRISPLAAPEESGPTVDPGVNAEVAAAKSQRVISAATLASLRAFSQSVAPVTSALPIKYRLSVVADAPLPSGKSSLLTNVSSADLVSDGRAPVASVFKPGAGVVQLGEITSGAGGPVLVRWKDGAGKILGVTGIDRAWGPIGLRDLSAAAPDAGRPNDVLLPVRLVGSGSGEAVVWVWIRVERDDEPRSVPGASGR
jgi:hypothetical protein